MKVHKRYLLCTFTHPLDLIIIISYVSLFLHAMLSSASSGSLSSLDSSFDEASKKFVACRRKKRTTTTTASKKGGSLPGKRRNRNRNRELYHNLLMSDYFTTNPTYDDCQFRRRFRMRQQLFDKIMTDVVAHDSYFADGVDACGVKSFSSYQKLTCALRYMAYGGCADRWVVVVVVVFSFFLLLLTGLLSFAFCTRLDETLRFAESTVAKVVDRFCRAIIEVYSSTYLRPPNEEDMKMILSRYEDLGWVGCMGCIDVMKWVWKNCLMAWRGSYQGKETHPTVALEAVVDSR